MAKLVGRKELEGHISHLPGVRGELFYEAHRVRNIAQRRLDQARASSPWVKIDDPDGMTTIEVHGAEGKYSQDYLVSMDGHKMGAMALEFGHAPSGVFGKAPRGPNGGDGRLSHIKTKAPYGLYIMTGAYIQA